MESGAWISYVVGTQKHDPFLMILRSNNSRVPYDIHQDELKVLKFNETQVR